MQTPPTSPLFMMHVALVSHLPHTHTHTGTHTYIHMQFKVSQPRKCANAFTKQGARHGKFPLAPRQRTLTTGSRDKTYPLETLTSLQERGEEGKRRGKGKGRGGKKEGKVSILLNITKHNFFPFLRHACMPFNPSSPYTHVTPSKAFPH